MVKWLFPSTSTLATTTEGWKFPPTPTGPAPNRGKKLFVRRRQSKVEHASVYDHKIVNNAARGKPGRTDTEKPSGDEDKSADDKEWETDEDEHGQAGDATMTSRSELWNPNQRSGPLINGGLTYGGRWMTVDQDGMDVYIDELPLAAQSRAERYEALYEARRITEDADSEYLLQMQAKDKEIKAKDAEIKTLNEQVRALRLRLSQPRSLL